MSESRRHFKIFLASPGDLGQERRTAKTLIDEYNSQLAEAFGLNADLVAWEDTLPGVGRPQARINRDLEQCELFIGMLWKRWGTPPDSGGRYTSGFEEEFFRSLERSEMSGQPQVNLLLKDIDDAAKQDPGEQLQKVLTFRSRIIEEKRILAKPFCDTASFERLFRACINGFAIQHRRIDPVPPQHVSV